MSINKRSKKKGFTLIELIIVIAIIAILAAIAIPNFLAIQRKAKVNADIATAKNIYDATSALITEGAQEFTMPKYNIDEDGKVNGGYSIYLTNKQMNTEGTRANELREYLATQPVVKSVKNGYYAVAVEFEFDKNGKPQVDKPKIRVAIFDSEAQDRRPIGEVYPAQTGIFNLDKKPS
ncbi:TPA: prepilin-type N-terminal cleavage/methylation domain-containing protein [Clostridium perfringens]